MRSCILPAEIHLEEKKPAFSRNRKMDPMLTMDSALQELTVKRKYEEMFSSTIDLEAESLFESHPINSEQTTCKARDSPHIIKGMNMEVNSNNSSFDFGMTPSGEKIKGQTLDFVNLTPVKRDKTVCEKSARSV
jgi:hypothetical protein